MRLWISRECMRFPVLLGSALFVASCGRGPSVPPAEDALREYVSALESSDAGKLRAMMTERARSEYSTREIESLLKRDAAEFQARAKELSKVKRSKSGEATVYLHGGRTASLGLVDGRFWIKSAGLVLEMPRTPEEAAESLRVAVKERSYSKIERTLSVEARGNFNRAFEELEESLKGLDSAIVNVRDERATIEFLDGRMITLRLEGTAWRVESFE